MSTWLKQSTAIEIKLGPFIDETDFITPMTGLTIEDEHVDLAKNDGDWGDKNETTTLVHESQGWYRCLLNSTDTDTLGTLIVKVHASGALPVWREFMVLPANVFDSLVSGSDTLDVQVTGMGTGVVTADAIAADAIGSSELAASAVNEIADQVWDEALSGHATAGSAGKTLADISSSSASASAIATATVNALLEEVLAESYAASGAEGTLPQILYMIQQRLTDFIQTGTTVTVRQLDGSTTAYTLSLDDASRPLAIRRT